MKSSSYQCILFALSGFLLVCLSFPAPGFAQTPPPAPPVSTPDKDKPVEIEGNFRLDNDVNPDQDGNLKNNIRFQKFEFQAQFRLASDLPFNLAKELLFVVRSKMEQDVVINGILNANHLTVTDYLKEAYIVIKQVGGLPVAIVVGTSEVAYGQDYYGTISLQNDANHEMSDADQGQVKGFTVTLDKSVKYIFDKVETSFFTSNGDIKNWNLKHFDGFAFRVTKDLGEHLVVESSYLHKGNAYDPELKPETKLSFGGIFRKDRWTLWGEGFSLKNSEAYPNATAGITGGASRITGPGQITVSAVDVKNTLKQYAVGYDLYLSPKWTAGPTVRYTSCVGGNAGCMDARGYGQGVSVGISAKYAFGGDNLNPTWIGKKGLVVIKKAFGGLGGDKHNTVNHPTGSTGTIK